MKTIGESCPNGTFAKDAAFLVGIFSKETKYYLEDCSAATQNILLAMEAAGLGACWIAGDKKPYVEDLRKMFGVPEGYRLVSMISAGYPKREQTSKPKRKLGELLHWEKW